MLCSKDCCRDISRAVHVAATCVKCLYAGGSQNAASARKTPAPHDISWSRACHGERGSPRAQRLASRVSHRASIRRPRRGGRAWNEQGSQPRPPTEAPCAIRSSVIATGALTQEHQLRVMADCHSRATLVSGRARSRLARLDDRGARVRLRVASVRWFAAMHLHQRWAPRRCVVNQAALSARGERSLRARRTRALRRRAPR